jgi:3-dehydroquinate synthase
VKEIKVALGPKSYNVCIGVRLEDLGKQLNNLKPLHPPLFPRRGERNKVRGGRVQIITHPHLKALYGARLAGGLHQEGFQVSSATFPAGEQRKNIATVQSLYAACAKEKLRRSSVIVALGGGVAGDVAGFVAATYLRGIRFVNVPTTLLAMVDSAIGGKTGVDLPQGKNLVGAFHQPTLVWCDLSTLKTLPSREWKTGMAEIVKYGVIRDRKLFGFLEKLFKNGPPCPLLAKDLLQMVERSATIKADVVSKDEFETRGLRQILNFGHTTAHALEASTSYKSLTHGEAVSIGMRAAGRIAVRLGLLNVNELVRLENLLTNIGLPTGASRSAFGASFWQAMAQDKKIERDELRFVLPTRIGHVIVRDVPKETVARALSPNPGTPLSDHPSGGAFPCSPLPEHREREL